MPSSLQRVFVGSLKSDNLKSKLTLVVGLPFWALEVKGKQGKCVTPYKSSHLFIRG